MQPIATPPATQNPPDSPPADPLGASAPRPPASGQSGSFLWIVILLLVAGGIGFIVWRAKAAKAAATAPGKRGDLYFQSAVLTREGQKWDLAGTAFGTKLRWGLCNVANPFVKITDEAGKEVSLLTLFQGKVGGLDADKKGPVSAKVSGIILPGDFRLFFGYESFYDQRLPKEAGGPEEVEIRSVLQDR